MKKRVSLFLVLLLTALLTMSVFADASYADIHELFRSWSDNRPDYVTGVWIEWDPDVLASYLAGEIEAPESLPTIVGLVPGEAGEAGLAEIRSLVADLSDVTFVEQNYSYNYLRSIRDELTGWLQKGVGMRGLDVAETANYVGIEMLDMDTDAAKEFMEMCRETYGDAVSFVKVGEPYQEMVLYRELVPSGSVGADNGLISAADKTDYRWIAWTAVAVVVLGTAGFLLLRRRASLLQPETGDVAVGAVHSRKAVEEMIRSTGEAPSAETDQAVLRHIESK